MPAIIILIVLIVTAGVYFCTGRGYRYIILYNDLSAKERAGLDEKAVCRFVGRMLLFFAFTLLILAGDFIWPGNNFFAYFITLVIFGMLYTTINLVRGKRFRRR